VALKPPIAHAALTEALSKTLPTSSRLLLAVSGGKDSVVLLDAVFSLVAERALLLGIAHVDHGLRADSSSDADFVHALAVKYSLPFYARRLTPAPDGRGVEAWARELRYQFFSEVLLEQNYDYTVTAHHADDRAETVLMRFLANREPSSIHEIDQGRKLIRPLLSVGRSEIDACAAQQQLEYREDASNQDISILRNRYRHRIIPYLEQELGTNLDRVLSERAAALEDDAQALEQLARHLFQSLAKSRFGSRAWLNQLRQALEQNSRALQWRLVERVLAAAYEHYYGRRVSLLVLDFILKGDLAIEIPGQRKIIRRDGGLSFNDVK